MKIFNKNQKASTILISLLIMSVVLSSTLYVNVISLRQMRQSNNVDNSIIAFYAAESGNEQAIYYIRKTEDLDVGDLTIGGSISGPDNLIQRTVTDELTIINIGLKKNEFYQIDIFDQEDISLGSDLSAMFIEWDSDCGVDSWIELTINEWEITGDVNWGVGEYQEAHIKKCLLNPPDDPDTFPIIIGDGSVCIDFNPNNAYQFRFKALYCDVSNLNISAKKDDNSILPFKNIYNSLSIGEYPKEGEMASRQALTISLRKSSPLSGLFDYVIFSEKSLIKDIGAYTGGWFTEDLFIATNHLPDGIIGENYNYTVTAVNGIPPYTWNLSGTYPPGFGINEVTGVLSGNVGSDPAIYNLQISVEDSISSTDEKVLFLEVIAE